jgi:protocatechuate 3,4-dioxygenase beta subunit
MVLNLVILSGISRGQLGNAGSIEGVVTDQSGGMIAHAAVEITYTVTGFARRTTTDESGAFRFTNVPFNPYHMNRPRPGLQPDHARAIPAEESLALDRVQLAL